MIGQRIQQLRTRAGLSQRQLAAEADLDPAAISRIEKGDSDPRHSTLQKIAVALDLSPAALLDSDWKAGPSLSDQIQDFVIEEGEVWGEDGNGRPVYAISLTTLMHWQALAHELEA